MLTEAADAFVWIVRLLLFSGLAWGAWLCLSDAVLTDRAPRRFQIEQFASLALLVLLLGSLGGLLHAG